VVPWRDGSVLVGATMEEVGFDERSTGEAVEALTSSVRTLLPRSEKATLESVRVGLRPALPDELPAIGRFAAAPRVVVATGHFRNGVLLAPLTADLVARLVVDGSDDPMLAAVSPERFLRP
jgi:glycine/D-amino acid oxidase-like deaminating enzyme